MPAMKDTIATSVSIGMLIVVGGVGGGLTANAKSTDLPISIEYVVVKLQNISSSFLNCKTSA